LRQLHDLMANISRAKQDIVMTMRQDIVKRNTASQTAATNLACVNLIWWTMVYFGVQPAKNRTTAVSAHPTRGHHTGHCTVISDPYRRRTILLAALAMTPYSLRRMSHGPETTAINQTPYFWRRFLVLHLSCKYGTGFIWHQILMSSYHHISLLNRNDRTHLHEYTQ